MEFVNLPSLMDYIENLAQPVQENVLVYIKLRKLNGSSNNYLKPYNTCIQKGLVTEISSQITS